MKVKVTDLLAGRYRIKVDALEEPDGNDEVPIYEDVIYVEDVGRCLRVHTDHHVLLLPEDTELEAEEATPE